MEMMMRAHGISQPEDNNQLLSDMLKQTSATLGFVKQEVPIANGSVSSMSDLVDDTSPIAADPMMPQSPNYMNMASPASTDDGEDITDVL